MSDDSVILNKERKVALTPFIAHRESTPAILILPGGGYNECSLSEGKPVAEKFNQLGFNTFVLCYSVGKHYRWPRPLEDYEAAVRYIRQNADRYHIDPSRIVAMGFSAGGHLAGAAATISGEKPFAAVLCYPAILSSTISYAAPDAPDIAASVTDDTCPCFIASSRNDWIVPIENTHRLTAALDAHTVDYESHIYGFSMHGFSIGKEVNAVPPQFCSRVGDWVEECVSWLRDLADGSYISIRDSALWQDAHAERFSSKNSVGLIFSTEEAKRAFRRKCPQYYLLVEAARKKVGSYTERVTIRNVLTFLNIKTDAYAAIDAALGEIEIKR
ncbi:MAG: alpha/beta hydrolase [Clostridia bacterium]|nr:alpha/beta hydrolase [Clostridia bacterium]